MAPELKKSIWGPPRSTIVHYMGTPTPGPHTLPERMRAAVLTGGAGFVHERHPRPRASKGEAIVRVHELGLCGSDAKTYVNHSPTSTPRILGHEIYGSVAELSPHYRGPELEVGQIVSVIPTIECGRCAECVRGDTHLCRHAIHMGAQRPGALAELLAVPETNLIALPETVRADERVLVEPLAVAVHAVSNVAPRSTDLCLILGAGSIGILIGLVMRERGVRDIGMADVSRSRLELSEKLGFTVSMSVPAGNGGRAPAARLSSEADVVFECVGSSELVPETLRHSRPGGTVALVGSQRSRITLNGSEIQSCERRLIGSYCYREVDFLEAIDLLATTAVFRNVPTSALMRRHPPSAVEGVLKAMSAGTSPVLKEIISYAVPDRT